MRAQMLTAAVTLACLPAPVHATGPLDPPVHRLTVRLIERTRASAPPLQLVLDINATQDTGAIAAVGFRRGPHGRRQVLDGEKSWYIEARHGGVWPVVTRDGAQQVPACPASVLCSVPALSPTAATFAFNATDRDLDYYLFVQDVPDVAISVNAGWRVREVTGGALLQYRDTGTSARVSVYNGQYAVEDFRGVSSPRVNGASVAFASIPCWPPPLPGGDGAAVLANATNSRPLARRTMECATYRSAASGGSDTATVWHNTGAAIGWAGSRVNRLVVAVLPDH